MEAGLISLLSPYPLTPSCPLVNSVRRETVGAGRKRLYLNGTCVMLTFFSLEQYLKLVSCEFPRWLFRDPADPSSQQISTPMASHHGYLQLPR